jgi:hypothetical protein
MAVRNEWVGDSAVESGKLGQSSKASGGKIVTVSGTFEIAAADDDASIFKLAKLPANAVPIKCDIYSDVITSSSSWDLGLYKEDGTVADVDIFMAAGDISGGKAITAPLNGLTNLGGADPVAAIGKKLWELLGLTVKTKQEAYVLALTANTIGSIAGTVSYTFQYILA